jgi:alkylation response protein AidB-like acyl-CoA dehydrogenase
MDLELTETQKSLRKTARSFLESECPWTVSRDLQNSDLGYSPEMWRKMADLGWMSLLVPEKYEGAGGTFLDLIVLVEEMGRAVLPSPFVSTALIGAQALLLAGTAEQKSPLLPKIAKGETITALALLEANPDYTAASIKTQAKPVGDDYIIQGTKLFVRDAHIADYIICAAKTDSKAVPKDSISLFLVKRDSPGVSCTKLNTIARDRQCEVVFNQVKVPKTSLLGKLNKGWDVVEHILQYATVAECADMVGVGQKALEMAVQHAKDRVQFGRPIGSFQAIQHECADMATYVEQSRWMTYFTVWKMEQGMPASLDISRTKAYVSEAVQKIVRRGHQIHGGVGFTLEHPLFLYYRRALADEVMYGNSDWHRKVIADAML